LKRQKVSQSQSSSGNSRTKPPVKEKSAARKETNSKETNSKETNSKDAKLKRKWVYKPQVISIEEASDEVKQAVARIRGELLKIKEYKKILSSEGLTPDDYDKIRESELIKQLIRIEKGLPAKSKPKKPRNAKKKKT
jgi:hypothetical protein